MPVMSNILSDSYYATSKHYLKMPSPSTDTMANSNYHSLTDGIDAFSRKLSEDTIIDVLRSNNVKQQIEMLDELTHHMQQNDTIMYLEKIDEILNIVRSLILNTLNLDLQISCLKFVQIIIKSIERLKLRQQQQIQTNQLDQCLLKFLMPSVIPLCASIKLQVRQFSIDCIQSYMKITNNLSQLFTQFIRYGIENSDLLTSKGFIESFNVFLSDEYKYEDYTDIVKSLVKHCVEATLEKSCMKALKRIESIVNSDDTFNDYLKKLSPNLKNFYLNLKRKENANANGAPPVTPRNVATFNSQPEPIYSDDFVDDSTEELLMNDEDDYDDITRNRDDLKFNLISNGILRRLFGEDELQRLNAIEQLNTTIKNLENVSVMHPYYEDFIIFIGNFIDDSNYQVRVGALEILYNFVKKLKTFIETCYKVICGCARQVMSQTHQSKIMKQLIMNIILLSIENMKNPNLIIESLLDRIKDKSSKAREECLNILIAALIKYGSHKFDLLSMFKRIFMLLFDIKRSVRLAALECVVVLFSKLKDRDRDIDNFFDLLDHNIDAKNLEIIKSIIAYRLNRNRYAKLNQDMTIEYGIKIPTSTTYGQQMSEPDIDWIISASASSPNSAALITQSGRLISNTPNYETDETNSQHQLVYKRKPSATTMTKRLPWEDQQQKQGGMQSVPKVMKSREVAPLKAFPIVTENLDGITVNSSMARISGLLFKPNYQPTASYQDIFLKRVQTIRNGPVPSSIDQIMPSKPTLARRNSGLNMALQNDIEDQDLIDNSSRYLTMQLTRTSAKNRKKLDRLFSYNQQTNENTTSELNSVRTHKTSDQYSESGVFTLSEYDQSIQNVDTIQRYTNNNSTTSTYSITLEQTPFNTKPKLLRTNSKPKIYQPSQQQQQQQVQTSPVNTATKHVDMTNKQVAQATRSYNANNVEIIGKKLMSSPVNAILNNGSLYTPTIFSQQQQYAGANSLSSVSTPVFIDNSSMKKRANTLRILNDSSSQSFYQLQNSPSNNNIDDENILDIVGKGLLQQQQHDESTDNTYQQQTNENIHEDDIPMSQSLQSRLRQKTQEKIEERQRKHSHKKSKQNSFIDNLNMATTPTNENNPDNFGLSISGYNKSQNDQIDPFDASPIKVQNQKDFDNMPVGPANGRQGGGYNYNFDADDAAVVGSELTVNASYSSLNTILPTLDSQIQHRPPIRRNEANDKLSSMKPLTSRNKSLQRTQSTIKPNESGQVALKRAVITPRNGTCEVEADIGFGQIRDDSAQKPFKNAESAFKDAMLFLGQDEWEKKCHAMNIIIRLSVYHEDLVVTNLHSIVVALLQEVKNLRSQVSRFALTTFADLFTHLKRYMDIDLDIAVKTIMQKNGESSDFIRADVDKCLDKMINNVTPHKALAALINGGASHRNALIRKTAAQFIYKTCELMGPGKILSGIKDVTERVLVTASQFVTDGPPDIRWYGRKIFHILMSYDEFDRMFHKYVNESTRKNIKEILDSIKVKGPGDVPTESARMSRKGMRGTLDPISKSAGVNINGQVSLVSANGKSTRFDPQTQEDIKLICMQMRNTDFRERIDAIEKFQVLCETSTEIAMSNIVPIFDKFNLCLTDSNSKVNYKALNTMFQITPILSDGLSPVIQNVIPLLAQNLASKNNEIQDIASNILDLFIEYLDGGILIQPFSNLAQHGNSRIRPQIINKLADLIPHVYTKKQKQIDLHVLPAIWSLLNLIKGSSSTHGSSTLNSAVARLVQNLYEQMGEMLFERAANNSNVSAKNLELLQDLAFRPI